MNSEIRITGEPSTIPAVCRFVVDRPVLEDRSFYAGSVEQAQRSDLCRRVFAAVEGISAVLVSHNEITVTKNGPEPWPAIGKQIGDAIREHITGGEPAVDVDVWTTMPSEDELRASVSAVLDREINPGVASHGGVIELLDVRGNAVYLRMGGGCQGCGMAQVTLKQGVESAIRRAVPAVGEILDVTDHAAGRNPYFAQSP